MLTNRMISRILSLFFIGAFMLALVGPAHAAPARPAKTAETTSLLQYKSGNHILGFAPDKVYLAGLDHALTVEFVGGQGLAPKGTAAPGSKAGSMPALEHVEYQNAWPGVDVLYTSAAGGLAESTYLVKPGAHPADIRLKYNTPARLMENGALRFAFENGYMTESAPIAFQVIDGKRLPVKVHFTLSDGLVGFAVGAYDPKYSLTIDPLYAWHAFYGSASYEDRGQAMASDSSGNVYVAGTSYGTWDGPGPASPLNPHAGGADIVVVKLDAAGVYQWHTFYGSSSNDFGNGIVSDSSGNVVVTGQSGATWDGPGPASPLNSYAGGGDITALKLDSSGAYLWHTFYGSASADIGNAIARDGSGNLVITGFSDATWDAPGPVSPTNTHAGSADIVVLKLDSVGAYTWHTFYGSANLDYGNAVTTDGSGYIYVTGQSRATWDGPGPTSPINAFSTGEYDIVVFKLDSAGDYVWHTFYGSTNYDFGDAIISDGSDIFVAGISNGAWGSPLKAYLGNGDLVVLKLNTAGVRQWHTFYGSAVGSDQAQAITSDGTFIYIAGYSGATWNGPGSAPPDNPYAGGLDIMALKLRASDGFYQWHTFFGFGDPDPDVLQEDQAFAITTFGAGNVLVAGSSLAAWDGPGSTVPLNAYAGTGDIVFINLDSTQPAVTVNQAAGQADPTTVPLLNFTAVFSEPINPASFTNTDVTTTCSKTPCTRSVVVSEIADDTTFNIAVTISGVTDLDPRTITASIAAGAVTDLTGNGNSSSTSTDNSVVYQKDLTPPSLQLYKQLSQPEPTSASPINFKVVFSEAIKVSTFTSADVIMGGTSSGTRTAVITEISPNNGTAFNIAVSGMVGDGTVTATIPAGVVTDLAGNANLASTDLDNDVDFFDAIPPAVTVNKAPSPQTDPTTAPTIKFRAVFSEPINASTFTNDDVTLGWTGSVMPTAVVSEIAPNDGTAFEIAVTGMTEDGTVTASIASGLVADPSAAANLNTASTSTDNSIQFFLDTTAPTVTVEQAGGQEDPTTDWTIHFTATFTDGPIGGPIDIATFTSGDVTLGGTAPGTLTAVVSEIAPNNGTAFDIAVSGMTGDGTVTASIAENTLQDLAGNWNTASTSTDNSVDYDFIPQFNNGIPAPVLRSPRNRALTNNAAPTFWWTSVRAGQNYEIVFATDSAFTSIVRSVIVGGTSYTPAPPLDDGEYYWRVRAYNEIVQYGSWSSARIITVDTTGPSAPVLTSPADDAFIRSGIFRWASVPTAVSYQFQLDDDADFSSPVIASIVRGTSRRLPPLPTGAYFWRVRARDAAGNWGAWSAEFTVNFTGP